MTLNVISVVYRIMINITPRVPIKTVKLQQIYLLWSFSRWHQWREWWSMQSWRVKHPGRRTCGLRTTGPREAASPSTESTSPTAPASLWSWRTWVLSSNPEKRFLSFFSAVRSLLVSTEHDLGWYEANVKGGFVVLFMWHYFLINY